MIHFFAFAFGSNDATLYFFPKLFVFVVCKIWMFADSKKCIWKIYELLKFVKGTVKQSVASVYLIGGSV